MLQETRLTTRDKTFLNKADGSLVFYNNYDDNRAGVATIIGAKLLANYKPQQIPNKNDFAKGHILQIFMEPKNARDRPFYLDNVYIKSGSSMAPKCRHIKCIQHAPSDLVFMAGDFNFTEHVKDGSSRLSGPAANAWQLLCIRLGFKEVAQEAHTYKSGDTSSRLDRFYTNMDEADRLLITPNAYMRKTASMKYSDSIHRKGDSFFSDHHPVSFQLFSTEKTKNRDFNCPKWLAGEEGFINEFNKYWHKRKRRGISPFEELDIWKSCVRSATKSYFPGA